MELNDRVNLFADMIQCCHPLYVWTYDSNLHLLDTNCPDYTVLSLYFMSEWEERISADFQQDERMPTLLSDEADITWVAIPLFEGDTFLRLYMLGPMFLSDISQQKLEHQLAERGYVASLRKAVWEFLKKVPVISLGRVFEYTQMLYFCLTGAHIHVSDLRYQRRENPAARKETTPSSAHGTYEAEREMLRMVREGDIVHFREHMDRMAVTGTPGRLSNGDPLRQLQNTVEVCAILFSRAAIEGGLSPETSYALTDQYFQSIEASTSLTEIAELTYTMQEDFVQRVHRCRLGKLSQPVLQCCDYIEFHLEEELTLPQLAANVGYTTYYLSRKFKAETGLSPSEYIRKKRLDRAAQMLRSGKEEIQAICTRLHFGSQSYFSDAFRREFGVTPTQYRNAGAPPEPIAGPTQLSDE